ncbi:MAG: hypothetical protein FWD27_03620 [Coriobacteriia bacterium]|nr:hypothetical protein [Coriobacteriia bacterium]
MQSSIIGALFFFGSFGSFLKKVGTGMEHHIIIDPEFKALLSRLDDKVFAALEADILENGCRDPLITWNNILIDGHHRYEICTKHGIPFTVATMEFATREDAKIYMIRLQYARRNLTPLQFSKLRGNHYKVERKRIRNEAGVNQFSNASADQEVCGNSCNKPQVGRTAEILGEEYKVGARTIMTDAKIATALAAIAEVSPEVEQKIVNRTPVVDKKVLIALAPKEEEMSSSERARIEELVKAVDEGSYARPSSPGNSSLESTLVDGQANSNASQAITKPAALAAAIKSMTDELLKELRQMPNDGSALMKPSLKAHISRLQDLHKRL